MTPFRNTKRDSKHGILNTAGIAAGLIAAASLAVTMPAAAAELAPLLYPAPTFPVGDGAKPADLVLADFNGDDEIDAAVLYNDNSKVSLIIGSAEGGFEQGQSFAIGADARRMEAGDFDGDGITDLAVTNSGDGTVSILTGSGNGSFATATYPAGAQPLGVAVSDLNGDGGVDLAVTDGGSGTVNILLGNGDGTFATPQSFGALGGPLTLAVADYDGTGTPDIAVGGSSGIAILTGHGDGTFDAARVITTSSARWGLETADLDGDGYTDLAYADFQTQEVGVLLGKGDSEFTVAGTYKAIAPTGLEISDLNQDAIPDLVTSTLQDPIKYSAEGGAEVFTGRGDGTFDAGAQFSFGAASWHGIGVTDVDDDGLQDLVVTTIGSASADIPGRLGVLYGKGDAEFGAPARYQAGGRAKQVVAADFDGDGSLDYAVSNSGDHTISFVMSGPPRVPLAAGTSDVQGIVSSDFNLDGQADLAAIVAFNQIQVFLGDGEGQFSASTTYAIGNYGQRLCAADFNGDGFPDLAVATMDDGISVLLGVGDGTFGPEARFGAGDNPFFVAPGDFDSDRNVDLVVTNSASSSLSILFGKGDGSFRTQVVYKVGAGPMMVATADFNSDGVIDIAVTNMVDSTVGVLIGAGDGSFATQRTLVVGGKPRFIRAGDVTGDGAIDLVVSDEVGLMVLIGKDDGTFSKGRHYDSAGLMPMQFLLRDVDSDGWSDIAVPNLAGTLGISLHRNPAPGLTKIEYEVVGGETLSDQLKGIGEFGLALTYSAADKPAHGTYDVLSDGSFTYTPDDGFSGSDSFKVTVDNGHAKSTGTVSIEVRQPEDAGDGDAGDGGDTGGDDTGNGSGGTPAPIGGGSGGDGGSGGGGSLGWLSLALLAPALRRRRR